MSCVPTRSLLAKTSDATLAQILDRHSAKEVPTAILHSILFHRLFGTVKPQTFEVLDVTMPGVSDPEMEQLVTEKVDILERHREWRK
ncbi:uncharacterized protein HD556DRAFT_1052295 [Suillus plorans]|uniref:Autophagy-related protein 101 n=1 Tax=Suillus plorans TaxID=116603 RepID=A0A9P7ACD8_9AGAM|nr:uncharacterized protein HD556DRAFT_1052295 [Suillus plorans]KAG1786469.1 hypothetical protein HD556DRAFT_1052295 [Suillus plorans]